LELSLLSLSLSLTLRHLDNSWSILALDEGKKRKDKEGKGKQISSKAKQDQAATMGLLVGIDLHVSFP